MTNIELFNEFALRLLDHLYDAFPVACQVDPDKFIEKVYISPYPPNPVDSYCGPDKDYWGFVDPNVRWASHDWDNSIVRAEKILGRKLSESESVELRSNGHRPLTDQEQLLVSEWEEKKKEADARRLTETGALEENEQKRKIFLATIQFLVSENIIRFKDIPPSEGQTLNPPDILIERATKRLQFVLTSKGLMQLNRNFKGRKLAKEIPFYQAIKQVIKEGVAPWAIQFTLQSLLAAPFL